MRLLLAMLLALPHLGYAAEPARSTTDAPFGLRQPESLRVAFTQEKRIPGIQRTLKASGHLVFSRTLGAIWRLEQPRPRETVIPARAQGKTEAEGEAIQAITSTLSGDLAALGRHFEIIATPTSEGGTIELRPRATAVRDVIERITLRVANRTIREIHIAEASGGEIHLAFSEPQLDYALSEADKAALVSPDR